MNAGGPADQVIELRVLGGLEPQDGHNHTLQLQQDLNHIHRLQQDLNRVQNHVRNQIQNHQQNQTQNHQQNHVQNHQQNHVQNHQQYHQQNHVQNYQQQNHHQQQNHIEQQESFFVKVCVGIILAIASIGLITSWFWKLARSLNAEKIKRSTYCNNISTVLQHVLQHVSKDALEKLSNGDAGDLAKDMLESITQLEEIETMMCGDNLYNNDFDVEPYFTTIDDLFTKLNFQVQDKSRYDKLPILLYFCFISIIITPLAYDMRHRDMDPEKYLMMQNTIILLIGLGFILFSF
ncbi:Translation initiation factor IF-2 [Wickerhamomyces ciferrii]|uniref:Translation initiation factor IF-2 n=1 Tax=Wickerhamomyces ciferrii (strain ATCC 14091 / BCRC 22168 / CBS 111 / JCM 3599 / NBRC 0793 / NRRL Y-1031 F-60-10) TaxID=1206466 RepID=K0KBF6_WICCF|nr:Translation initiation factor IF-2 [Wickerhamomyces ciferrii]CCH42350.1 Translation initiation factor IF-2 [Wickerhamomyces ciferrii]